MMDKTVRGALLALGLLLGAGLPLASDAGSTPNPSGADARTVVEIGGGTVELPAGFNAGPRFLQQVPVPDHVANPPKEDPENEVPGDGHDDGLVITKRRYSSRGHEELPVTGNVIMRNVHGTAENPICICDATFVMWNRTVNPPSRSFRLIDSSHILIDNVTIHGGGFVLETSHHITVTRSLFMDDGAVVGEDSWDITVRDNDFIEQAGLLDWYDHPPVHDECWPSPQQACGFTGLLIWGGGRWHIDYNYIDGGGGISGSGDIQDVRIRHNTLYNGGSLLVGDGESEVSWNLVRGWGQFGVHVAGSTTANIVNNSFIMNSEIDLGDTVFDQSPAAQVYVCGLCIVEDNDFIGYGVGAQVGFMAPALRIENSNVRADGNYWGTLHDPRLPPDTWIRMRGTGALELNDWALAPNHPVSIGLFLNPQDYPFFYEEITGDEWPLDP